MTKRYFTKDGIEKLKKELEELRTKKRQEIAERLHETAGYGDLSENSEYQEAKEAQAQLEVKIAELEETLRNAMIANDIAISNVVTIGSAVKAKSGNANFEFKLVGAAEASPWEGKISIESPLGKALLSRQKGDSVEVETPEGKRAYKILEIT